jgi:PAS domain-containing protein
MDAECWVETDRYGRAVDASPAGARLLNLTVRGLVGRQLWLFFLERQDLERCLRLLRAGAAQCPEVEVSYRPLEKKPERMVVHLTQTGGEAVRWQLTAVAAPNAPES